MPALPCYGPLASGPPPLARNPGSAQLQLLTQNPLLFLLRKAFYSFEKHLFCSLPPVLVQGVWGARRLDCTPLFCVALSGAVLGSPVWGCPSDRTVHALVCGCTQPWVVGFHFLSLADSPGGQKSGIFSPIRGSILPPCGQWVAFSGPFLPCSPGALWGPSFTEGGSQAQPAPLSPPRFPASPAPLQLCLSPFLSHFRAVLVRGCSLPLSPPGQRGGLSLL